MKVTLKNISLVFWLPEFFYFLLLFLWTIRAYFDVDIIYPAIVSYLLFRMLYFEKNDFLRYGLYFFVVFLYLVLKDIIWFGHLREYLFEGVVGVIVAAIIVSTSKFKYEKNILNDLWVAYVVLALFFIFIVAINYFVPSEVAIEFKYSVDYTGRFFIGDSRNPIWIAYIAGFFVAMLTSSSLWIKILVVAVYYWLYELSKNEGQLLVVPFLLLYFICRNFYRGKYFIALILTFISIVVFLYVMVMVVNFFTTDSSSTTRLFLLIEAFNRWNFVGDPSAVFYVDVPLIEILLEFGFIGFFIVAFLVYTAVSFFLRICYVQDARLSTLMLSSFLIFIIAQVHYRPLEYSFLVPACSLIFWYSFSSRYIKYSLSR